MSRCVAELFRSYRNATIEGGGLKEAMPIRKNFQEIFFSWIYLCTKLIFVLCFSWLWKACRVVSSRIAALPSIIICLEFQPFSRRTLIQNKTCLLVCLLVTCALAREPNICREMNYKCRSLIVNCYKSKIGFDLFQISVSYWIIDYVVYVCITCWNMCNFKWFFY